MDVLDGMVVSRYAICSKNEKSPVWAIFLFHNFLFIQDLLIVPTPKGAPYVLGKRIYERILIRRKQPKLYQQNEVQASMAAEPKAEYGEKNK